MKLELATAHQILLELSETDLQRFGLTVDSLLLPSAQTRAKLQLLLSALGPETGQAYALQQTSQIDVLPDRNGGCLLIVSGCTRKGGFDPPLAFYTTEIDDLIDAARAVCTAKQKWLRLSLLQIRGSYLVLPCRMPREARQRFAEFLRPVFLSDAACAVLREHGRTLLEDAPVSALCGGA